ncbi:response regulator transcription factor [Lachnobacterium bovis]|uniref:response regulator transcription factor n=1 Tax=Lachnobacterium bovis TaxID=140626 RepID=UPI0003B6D17C|nr:response regulator transcription factor [Lachnobacterium bovis]
MIYQCLIVEDERELAEATSEYFNMFDIKSAFVEEGKDCFKFLEENQVSILLLDINLKNENGIDICRKVREKYDLPIIFISARQKDDDILVALSSGGDDYVKKPYSLSVLMAKVKATLRRLELNNNEKECTDEKINYNKTDKNSNYTLVSEEENIIKLDNRNFTIIYKGKKIYLKAREFALLQELYNHRGEIVTKEELFETVWQDGFYSDSTLNVHIRRLREKIENDPSRPQLIKTIWGTGYKLDIWEND